MRSDARHDFMAQAVEACEAIRQAKHRHAFEHAVGVFTQLLSSVPDYKPYELSPDAIGPVRTLAEDVIARIEERVAAAHDSNRVQLHLVAAVYEIRRALEEIDRWRRHYINTG